MKGIIQKSNGDYIIQYSEHILPLHPEDVKFLEGLFGDKIFLSPIGDEVKFEIIDMPFDPDKSRIWIQRFAKIIWE